MLTEYHQKVKDWTRINKQDIYVSLIIFLVGLGSFGLGRLSVVWKPNESLKVDNIANTRQNTPIDGNSPQKAAILPQTATLKGQLVASKSGTAYHFPWCPGALKIKEENKVWFQTKAEAESRGYKPAGNCPGL